MSAARTQLVDRFWMRMAEKFGKRWLEERGTQPNAEWCSLVNRFTEYQINLALDNLPKWDHPPTHPVMAAHLRTFSAKDQEITPAKSARDYWRSIILSELIHWGWLKGYWNKITSAATLPSHEKARLFAAARRILDEAVDGELQLGQRSEGLYNKVSKDCERVIAVLRTQQADTTVDRHP